MKKKLFIFEGSVKYGTGMALILADNIKEARNIVFNKCEKYLEWDVGKQLKGASMSAKHSKLLFANQYIE